MKKYNYIRRFAVMAALAVLTGCNDVDIDFDEEPENTSPGGGAMASSCFEYTPAPGQFINEEGTGNWTASTTAKEAAEWALERLNQGYTVSLGAFGGRIVVGFDHDVANTRGGYEIGITGNAFISADGSSNEPGVCYVMQDTNGNGLPDDTWYELRGSDTFASTTQRDYSVTYFRPTAEAQPVRWTDSNGKEGEIPYMASYHTQPTYYPLWIKADSYTLSGTCLEARTELNTSSGKWMTMPYGWGYADNIGDDNTMLNGKPNGNRFRISDAIDADGNPVDLSHINFVKVQTAVNFVAGWLGEMSTEISSVVHLTYKP